MSERTPITVRLVTVDAIHDDVEFELDMEARELKAQAANGRSALLSTYWIVDGPRTAREINTLLEAITPQAQVIADAVDAIEARLSEAI